MNRYGAIFLGIAQFAVVSAWGQENGALGSLLPTSPSPHTQISARFLFAEQTPERAEVEEQVREAIVQIIGDGYIDLTIECRVSICRAGLVSRPDDLSISRLWEAKGTRELLAWEESPLSELAQDTGFDGVEPVRLEYSDRSRQLLLYLFDSQ